LAGAVLPLAHAGHWALWALYAVPIIIVLGSIVLSIVRDRRGDGDGRSGHDALQQRRGSASASHPGDRGHGVDEDEAGNGQRDARP
jgi:hypothetical protein